MKNYDLKAIGAFTFQQVDKEGMILKQQTFKNRVVETGIEFLLDLMINTTTNYEGNTSISQMAAGSINTAAVAGDWRLHGEGTVNEGGSVCRVTLDPQTSWSLTTVTFHGVFTSGDFPVLPYTIGEIGAFLGDRPPTNDPQDDSSQRPYTMFNRIVLDPVWVKYDDETDLRFIYTVTITGSD